MFTGKGGLVWNLPPDPRSLARVVERYGFDWLAFKIHDGGSAWGESRNVDREYVDNLRGLLPPGYTLAGWGYCYLDGAHGDQGTDADGVPLANRGNGDPYDTASAAVGTVNALGLDGYIADIEIQAEAHPDLVRAFFQSFDGIGAPDHLSVAVTTWADLHGHQGVAIDGARWWNHVANWLTHRAGALMPMVYRVDGASPGSDGWVMLSDNRAQHLAFNYGDEDQHEDWAEAWSGAVCPVFSAWTADVDGLRQDVRDAELLDCEGAVVWSVDLMLYGGTNPAHVEHIDEWLQEPWFDDQVTTDDTLSQDISNARGTVFDAAGDIVNYGAAAEGLSYQAVVRYYKGEISRTDALVTIHNQMRSEWTNA